MTPEVKDKGDELSSGKKGSSRILGIIKQELGALGGLGQFSAWTHGFSTEVEQIIALGGETGTAQLFFSKLHKDTQNLIINFRNKHIL